MKRPRWASILGIIGILISCLSFFLGTIDVISPWKTELQKEILLENKTKFLNNDEGKHQIRISQMDLAFIQECPEENLKWFAYLGIAEIISAALFLLSSIWLLLLQPLGIRLFPWAAGCIIAVKMLQSILAAVSLPSYGIVLLVPGLIWALINIKLIRVISSGNKDAFYIQAG
jgi:hypothetical protein